MRFPGLALAAVLMMGALTACGTENEPAARAGDAAESDATRSTDRSGTWPADATITEEEARSAVLTLDDLSSDFVVAEEDDDDDENDTDLGCFLDLEGMGDDEDDEDEEDEDPDVEVEFETSIDPGMPLVSQMIFTEDLDEDEAEQVLDTMAELMQDCTEIDTTDDEGTRIQLEVMLDELAWAPGADQQVNLTASGTIGMSGIELPMVFHLTMVRLQDVVTMLLFADMAREAGEANQALVTRATGRLDAVINGTEPPAGGPLLEDYPIGAALEGLDPSQQDV